MCTTLCTSSRPNSNVTRSETSYSYPTPHSPVGFREQRVLLDGQRRELGRLVQPATLEVNRGQQQQHAGVVALLAPQLHAVTFGVFVVHRLVLAMGQLEQA